MGGNLGKDIPFNLHELKRESKYTTFELKRWYTNFCKLYPERYISTKEFRELYCKIYPEMLRVWLNKCSECLMKIKTEELA